MTTRVEYPPLSNLLDESFEPDYLVESRELTDREREDFRIMFADYCARLVYTD